MSLAYASSARKMIVYDPWLDLDARHVAMFEALGSTEQVRMPFAGHFSPPCSA
jgi:hypothetical protein